MHLFGRGSLVPPNLRVGLALRRCLLHPLVHVELARGGQLTVLGKNRGPRVPAHVVVTMLVLRHVLRLLHAHIAQVLPQPVVRHVSAHQADKVGLDHGRTVTHHLWRAGRAFGPDSHRRLAIVHRETRADLRVAGLSELLGRSGHGIQLLLVARLQSSEVN